MIQNNLEKVPLVTSELDVHVKNTQIKMESLKVKVDNLTDPLIPCSFMSDDVDLWSMSDDVPSPVPDSIRSQAQDLDAWTLDVIPQPSFPSPEYESDDLSTMDPYLSPRGEERMDISEMGSRTISPADDFVNLFEDVLDENYHIPTGSHPFDAELHDYLVDANSNDSIKLETRPSEFSDDDVCASPVSNISESCEKLITKENIKKPLDIANNPQTQVIIVKRKDGTNKVLNVVPILRKCTAPTVAAEVSSSFTKITTSASRASSPVRRSARTMKCSRQFKPVSPEPMKMQNISAISKPKAMYPEENQFDTIDGKGRKNAIQAKMNREKKKAYLSTLEDQVSVLSKENKKLSCSTSRLQKEKDSLANEVDYLRSVLANQSTLSKLLGNIPNVDNISLTTSFSRKRSASDDHDYISRAKSHRSESSGGVCLHVANDNVSLEFCAACSRMATDPVAERVCEE